VKIGEKGALIQSGEEIVEIEAVGTNVIDTTGAGDLFASGFLFGLLNDWPLEKAGKAGAIMAGKIISKIGGRLSLEEIVDVKNQINTLI